MNPLLRETPFVPYGPSHLIVLAVFVVGAWFAAHLGRAQRDTPAAAAFCRRFALAILVFELPLQILGALPAHWSVNRSLPFELCDLAWMAAALALWTRHRWADALLYYWGLTLTPQAILTPALRYDFPHIAYFMFWGGHLMVVWAAVYLTWGLGLRPDWRSYRFALLATTAWAALMLVFNTLTGSNYLFVNHKPDVHSLLDLLGPWPWYLAAEFALVAIVWALMTWPWAREPHTSALTASEGATSLSPMKKLKSLLILIAVSALLVCGAVVLWHFWPRSGAPELPSVAGWHHDAARSRKLGIDAQVPDGKTFKDADAVVYAMAVPKAELPGIQSVEALMESDRLSILGSGPLAQEATEKPLKTADGVMLPSISFSPGRRGGWDRVSYAERRDSYIVIALSAKDRSALDKAMADYEKFVTGFRLGR